MKSFFKSLMLLLVAISLWSCQEDEDKNLQTDLSIEANQLFGISTALGESLYFGLLDFEDFSTIPTNQLPGCPIVSIDFLDSQVTLSFDPSIPCEQSGSTLRSGKLILKYPTSPAPKASWTMEYEDYSFQGDTIQGTREFSKSSSNQVSETFIDLKTSSSRQVQSVFSGVWNHSLTKLRQKLVGISTTGSSSGTNAAGRDFAIVVADPRQALTSCFSQNEILPIAGNESWTIERGKNKSVTHRIKYESAGSCASTAQVTLSDGRNLQLIP